MNWRSPKMSLPESGQTVFVMLAPHKDRGDLLSSAMSIQIVCGVATYSQDGKQLEIQNYDELGMGNIGWSFGINSDSDEPRAMAWVPVQEMFERYTKLSVVPSEPSASPTTEVPQELLDAENRCPEVKFVQDCREFFNQRGFLSVKQRSALTFSGTPNRRHRQFCGWDPES